ncbi:MAG: flagellar motor switch protein FliN [Armatimonadota bacterium]
MTQLQLIQQFSELLPSIWETVGETVSSNSPVPAKFSSPIAMRANVSEVSAELAGNILAIQFAMANNPEAMQMILVRPETVLEVAKVVTGMSWEEVDDDVMAEVRPFAESIVQGLCLGLGNALLDTVVATGMSIRYQMIQLADNLAHAPSVLRCNIAMQIGEETGVILWLMDDDTAKQIVGGDEEEEAPIGVPGIPAMQMGGMPMIGGSAKPAFEHDSSMDVLLDVPLEISVELGRVKMVVRDVLDLGTGSIVEVDKAAGEPVDVMVNGRLVAKGEVVVIEDNFGVRITEILNPAERFRMDAAA